MQSKTSLGNVNSLHAHLFFAFFRPGLSTLEYRNSYFLVFLCHMIEKRPNLKVANNMLLYQQVKIPRQFQCHISHDVCPYVYFWWRGYLQGPWVLFVMAGDFSVRVTEIAVKIEVSRLMSHSWSFLLRSCTEQTCFETIYKSNHGC